MNISIITPSFNQGKFIERTLQSVLNQTDNKTYTIEYVVMDGGSSDETIAILKRYEDKIKWVSECDKGQTHAVNKGLNATSGDIIGWLNSDDIYYPNTIKKISEFFTTHPDIDVAYGEAYFIDKEDNILNYYPTEKWNLEKFKSRCFISQPATFFRRRVVIQYGLLDENLHFCMDYEYWLRLGLRGVKFAYIPCVLAATRIYPETKTASGYLRANQEVIAMLKKHIQIIPPEWIVSQCGTNVRSQYGYHFPHPYFAIAVWLNLWKATGEFQTGIKRIGLWIVVQGAMISKLSRRIALNVCKRITQNKKT